MDFLYLAGVFDDSDVCHLHLVAADRFMRAYRISRELSYSA
jgi:hypothetical protein